MKRTITIRDGVGVFDTPTFYSSENEDIIIYLKNADGKHFRNYKILVRHGDLMKAFTVFSEGCIELKSQWIRKNNQPIEFEMVKLNANADKIENSGIINIEPLIVKHLQGEFEYSAALQKLLKWQEEHGNKLEALEKRFESYECNGTILQTE